MISFKKSGELSRLYTRLNQLNRESSQVFKEIQKRKDTEIEGWVNGYFKRNGVTIKSVMSVNWGNVADFPKSSNYLRCRLLLHKFEGVRYGGTRDLKNGYSQMGVDVRFDSSKEFEEQLTILDFISYLRFDLNGRKTIGVQSEFIEKGVKYFVDMTSPVQVDVLRVTKEGSEVEESFGGVLAALAYVYQNYGNVPELDFQDEGTYQEDAEVSPETGSLEIPADSEVTFNNGAEPVVAKTSTVELQAETPVTAPLISRETTAKLMNEFEAARNKNDISAQVGVTSKLVSTLTDEVKLSRADWKSDWKHPLTEIRDSVDMAKLSLTSLGSGEAVIAAQDCLAQCFDMACNFNSITLNKGSVGTQVSS